MSTAVRMLRQGTLVTLIIALAGTMVSLFYATTAGAVTPHKVTHKAAAAARKTTHKATHKATYKPAAKPKPVTTCPSLGRVHPGVYAWMDDRQGMRSPLYQNLDKLICSAADRSRIEIKSWFVYSSGTTITQLAAHLALMHRYHHVNVVILVGRNAYATSSWTAFVHKFQSFATIESCPRRCTAPGGTGISHAKFVTVSQLRSGGSAVLSTSANFTDQQFGTVEHGIFVAGDAGLYRAFHNRFTAWATHTAAVVAGTWTGYANGVAAYFSPLAPGSDPDHEELATVDCTRGGLIEITSLQIGSRAVIRDLDGMRQQGCTVRVITEHRSPALDGVPLVAQCAVTHDKSIVIDTPGLKEVIAGSEDFAWAALHINEQQMLRVRSAPVVAAFERQFTSVWHRQPITCLP